VKILESDPQIKVVGVARNGQEAVDLVRALRPDVVTMDIRMPVMDGFQATQAIMAEHPTPILVISASVGSDDLKISFNAIQAGALDIIEKPRGNLQSGYEKLGAQIVRRVRMIAEIRVFRHISPRLQRPIAWTPPAGAAVRPPEHVVAIGASTGGPSALLSILQAAPAGFPAPVFVTQHISEGLGAAAPSGSRATPRCGSRSRRTGSACAAASSTSPRTAACSRCGASGRSRLVGRTPGRSARRSTP
jgi:two-component system chemotaxis response regulator CheB